MSHHFNNYETLIHLFINILRNKNINMSKICIQIKRVESYALLIIAQINIPIIVWNAYTVWTYEIITQIWVYD